MALGITIVNNSEVSQNQVLLKCASVFSVSFLEFGQIRVNVIKYSFSLCSCNFTVAFCCGSFA